MRQNLSRMAVVMALVGSVVCLQAVAYGFPKPKPAKVAAKAFRRAPATFRKLSLNEEQTNKLNEVQAKYDDQIEALNQQLKDLKAKEQAELVEVLTADQKKTLKDMEEAIAKDKAAKAEQAKAERVKKAEKAKADKAAGKTEEKKS